MHRRTRDFRALPLAMHAASTVADPLASHTALDGAVLLIEAARTHAPGISAGGLAVLPCVQRAQLAGNRPPRHATGRGSYSMVALDSLV